MKKLSAIWFMLCVMASVIATSVAYAESVAELRARVERWEHELAREVVAEFDRMVKEGLVKKEQLTSSGFFYWPDRSVTSVEKWNTVYRDLMRERIRPIQDRYLARDKRLVYFAIMDMNCYAPTHNTRFSAPVTGNPEKDMKFSRDNRFFVDPVGLRAARNTGRCLAQKYPRNTGEFLLDISCPFSYNGEHWGAVRAGFSVRIDEEGKERIK